jgi:hypothetical protein
VIDIAALVFRAQHWIIEPGRGDGYFLRAPIEIEADHVAIELHE